MKWKHVRWCEEVQSYPNNKKELVKVDRGLRKKLLALFFQNRVRMNKLGKEGTLNFVKWFETIRCSCYLTRTTVGNVEFLFKVDVRGLSVNYGRNEVDVHLELWSTENLIQKKIRNGNTSYSKEL